MHEHKKKAFVLVILCQSRSISAYLRSKKQASRHLFMQRICVEVEVLHRRSSHRNCVDGLKMTHQVEADTKKTHTYTELIHLSWKPLKRFRIQVSTVPFTSIIWHSIALYHPLLLYNLSPTDLGSASNICKYKFCQCKTKQTQYLTMLRKMGNKSWISLFVRTHTQWVNWVHSGVRPPPSIQL